MLWQFCKTQNFAKKQFISETIEFVIHLFWRMFAKWNTVPLETLVGGLPSSVEADSWPTSRGGFSLSARPPSPHRDSLIRPCQALFFLMELPNRQTLHVSSFPHGWFLMCTVLRTLITFPFFKGTVLWELTVNNIKLQREGVDVHITPLRHLFEFI